MDLSSEGETSLDGVTLFLACLRGLEGKASLFVKFGPFLQGLDQPAKNCGCLQSQTRSGASSIFIGLVFHNEVGRTVAPTPFMVTLHRSSIAANVHSALQRCGASFAPCLLCHCNRDLTDKMARSANQGTMPVLYLGP